MRYWIVEIDTGDYLIDGFYHKVIADVVCDDLNLMAGGPKYKVVEVQDEPD